MDAVIKYVPCFFLSQRIFSLRTVFIAALTATLLASPAHAENLLINSGFETLDSAGLPRPWSLFLMPKEGAQGRVDTTAMHGESSIMLYTPEPYDTEPANNWSQVIISDAASKDIRLRGYIRTEEATEAALWLQCFSRSPARVIAAQTSSVRTPIFGTMDWTRVEVRLAAPKQTDFLVVRCVLKGVGTAWFDSIELWSEEEEPAEEALRLDPQKQRELEKEILALSASIQESIRDLESSNTVLLERIATVQRELAKQRARVLEEAAAAREHPLEPLDAYQVRHPLVPHRKDRGGSPE